MNTIEWKITPKYCWLCSRLYFLCQGIDNSALHRLLNLNNLSSVVFPLYLLGTPKDFFRHCAKEQILTNQSEIREKLKKINFEISFPFVKDTRSFSTKLANDFRSFYFSHYRLTEKPSLCFYRFHRIRAVNPHTARTRHYKSHRFKMGG